MKKLLVGLFVLASMSANASECEVAFDSGLQQEKSLANEFTEILSSKGYKIKNLSKIEVCHLEGYCEWKWLDLANGSNYAPVNTIAFYYGIDGKTYLIFSGHGINYKKKANGDHYHYPWIFIENFKKKIPNCPTKL